MLGWESPHVASLPLTWRQGRHWAHPSIRGLAARRATVGEGLGTQNDPCSVSATSPLKRSICWFYERWTSELLQEYIKPILSLNWTHRLLLAIWKKLPKLFSILQTLVSLISPSHATRVIWAQCGSCTALPDTAPTSSNSPNTQPCFPTTLSCRTMLIHLLFIWQLLDAS